jgi:hypothetical protein
VEQAETVCVPSTSTVVHGEVTVAKENKYHWKLL